MQKSLITFCSQIHKSTVFTHMLDENYFCIHHLKSWGSQYNIYIYIYIYIYVCVCVCVSGPGSSVGIATDYGLDSPGIRIPVGRDFPPVQTGPGAHPASCTGTRSFPRVKYGRGMLLTTHPLLMPWSWKSRAIPLPTLWATTGPVMGTLYLSYLYIQGVTRGTDQTSGGCSLC